MSRSSRTPRILAIVCAFLLATAVLLPVLHVAAAPVSAPQLIFNEIHADPAAGLAGDANGDGLRSAQQDEFVEWVNAGLEPLDLSGWTLADATAVRHTFPAGTILAPWQPLLLFGGGVPNGEFGGALVQIADSGRLDLDNYSDVLTLMAPDGFSLTLAYDASLAVDQALVRSPDLVGEWLPHLQATGEASRFSPGTRLDGQLFAPAPANEAPRVTAVLPPDGALSVPLTASLHVTFSEAVTTTWPWADLFCEHSGDHTLTATAVSPAHYTLETNTELAPFEQCTATLRADHIADLGQPPLPLAVDYQWRFTSALPPDDAPALAASAPVSGAEQFPITATLALTLSEPVQLQPEAADLVCGTGGSFALTVSGGPISFALAPQGPLPYGRACTMTLPATAVADLDLVDPPDHPQSDIIVPFTTAPAGFVLINEIDAANLGPDMAEFIELYDGGVGGTALDGLSLVLYDGRENAVYWAYDLAGYQTNAAGYFVAGSAGLPGNDPDLVIMDDEFLHDGPAAVALYAAPLTQFPVGAGLRTTDLVDAVVYSANSQDATSLLPLLLDDQLAVDENERNLAEFHSSQRCPNGSGGQRRTVTFAADYPSPGAANDCVRDEAPAVTAVLPPPGAYNVLPDEPIIVTFSEEVSAHGTWATVSCARSGVRTVSVPANGTQLELPLQEPFSRGELCTVSLIPSQISDVDAADPPDHPAPTRWSFRIMPPEGIVINEVDSDTPGPDTAEFIELFDGGQGGVYLDGLILVLYNGRDDAVYHVLDLTGYKTGPSGFFVAGNASVTGADLPLPVGGLQNGPDAVALYAGDVEDFPIGSPVKAADLRDALVYGPLDHPDVGLLPLLAAGQAVVDEDGRGAAELHANQRCPDGAGGPRHTESYLQNNPTPGVPNSCIIDQPPAIAAVSPAPATTDVTLQATLAITFTEAVSLQDGAVVLDCAQSGTNALQISGGPTAFALRPNGSFHYGETCTAAVEATAVRDVDGLDPPDQMTDSYVWSFATLSRPVAADILINEVDSNTPGLDTAEFIELYDGGRGNIQLDGLILVLYNGSDDAVYRVIDLAGYETDERGFFVLGNASVTDADLPLPVSSLQNGPDAVALYAADPDDFPIGSPVKVADLRDALVYGPLDQPDAGLLPLLAAGQTAVDENGRGAADLHANQRCPDGAGSPRQTEYYLQNSPTPGLLNNCIIDQPPGILSVSPAPDATAVALEAGLTLSFSEAVSLQSEAVTVICDRSGPHTVAVQGGPLQFSLTRIAPFAYGETCHVTVAATGVSDVDLNDPPDKMYADFAWSFTTAVRPVATQVLINELDADTPGLDTAEFVELYDGGFGGTLLDGLLLVFYNGRDASAYRVVDLAGLRTNEAGYALVGAAASEQSGFALPPGAIQNGPDAVALYAADAAEFKPGMPALTTGLIDALVYHTGDGADEELLAALQDPAQANEAALRAPEIDSAQRCPDGNPGALSFTPNLPTPGAVNACDIDALPQVQSVKPANGAGSVSPVQALKVTFSESMAASPGWLSLTCDDAAAVPLTVSGGPRVFEATPESGSVPAWATCTAVIAADRLVDRDGYPDPLPADFTWQFHTGPHPFAGCGAPSALIHDLWLRRAGESNQDLETIEAVVTGDFQGSTGLGGFYMQEEPADADTDPATSEAIFVPDAPGVPAVRAGELIRLQGRAIMSDGMLQFTAVAQAAVCPGEFDIPAVTYGLPPEEGVARQGMLVSLKKPLTVIDNSQLGSDGRVALAPNWQPYPTTQMLPGAAAHDLLAVQVEERLWLDDGSQQRYPLPVPALLGAGETVRAGDIVMDLTGVLSPIPNGDLLLQPTAPVTWTIQHARPLAPEAKPGQLRLALVDAAPVSNGAGGEALDGLALQRQRDKLVSVILESKAEIIVLTGIADAGQGLNATVQALVAALNTAARGARQFASVNVAEHGPGTAVTTALVYDRRRVFPSAEAVLLSLATPFDMPPPLLQVFEAPGTDHEVTLLVPQFAPRDSCPAAGDANADQADGQACWNQRRTAEAEALAVWLQENEADPALQNLVILGEFFAYAHEDPLQVFAAADWYNLTSLYTGDESYDRVENGRAGTTRHALATAALAAQIAGLQQWHHNAAEPAAFDYRIENQPGLYQADPYRAAQSDTLLIDLGPAAPEPGFTTDGPHLVRQPVRFRNTSTGPQPMVATWDFGDGTPLVVATHPSHVYTAVGSYDVQLRVTTVWGATAVYSGAVEIEPRRLHVPLVVGGAP